MDYMGLSERFDRERTFLPAGQSAGLIHEIKPAAQIMRDIVSEAEEVIRQRFVEPALQQQR